MAAAAAIPQSFFPLSKPKSTKPSSLFKPLPAATKILSRPNLKRQSLQLVSSVANDFDVIVKSEDRVDQQDGVVFLEREAAPAEVDQVVAGFGSERLSFEGAAAGFSSASSGVGGPESGDGNSEEDMERLIDRAINATIVLAAGSFAITKLLTIDHDYWHGWTLFEILRYAPQHSWSAYEEALKTNPVLAKMVISGVVYSVGDWIAQCYEGKPLFEFDRARMFRSGLLGFTLHGSLSHYYYQFCEESTNGCNYCRDLKTWMKLGRKPFENAFAVFMLFVQLTSPIPLTEHDSWLIPPAEAVLYSPETKIPRTGELALRRAIPANKDMKAIQDSLEDISYLLRIPQRKPFGTMEGNVKKALKIAVDEKESILSSMPAEFRENGSVLYTSLTEGKGGLKTLLQSINDKDADKVAVGLASTLDIVAQMELLQAPGISFLLPQQYLSYPRLTGRAVVEFAIEKGDGSTFSPVAAGQPRNTAILQVVIDGFSAPLTAGNFAKLVVDGAYDGMKLNCTDQAILSDSKLGKDKGYSVPLEIMPSGQFEPLYKTTLSVQDGELPVLPLSVYGAVVMAHNENSEEYSSPNQFFFYLYDKRNAGLGGLSFDEGQFAVFGYTTTGRETLAEIKTGDVIRSAKLVEGQDRLLLPKQG